MASILWPDLVPHFEDRDDYYEGPELALLIDRACALCTARRETRRLEGNWERRVVMQGGAEADALAGEAAARAQLPGHAGCLGPEAARGFHFERRGAGPAARPTGGASSSPRCVRHPGGPPGLRA